MTSASLKVNIRVAHIDIYLANNFTLVKKLLSIPLTAKMKVMIESEAVNDL
ncbi:MAG TPA: hypothetical protein PLD88_09965 [Candidatus Berkiella sp.]|nr:hypothetical protein [Candidatus Berkiella sp.]